MALRERENGRLANNRELPMTKARVFLAEIEEQILGINPPEEVKNKFSHSIAGKAIGIMKSYTHQEAYVRKQPYLAHSSSGLYNEACLNEAGARIPFWVGSSYVITLRDNLQIELMEVNLDGVKRPLFYLDKNHPIRGPIYYLADRWQEEEESPANERLHKVLDVSLEYYTHVLRATEHAYKTFANLGSVNDNNAVRKKNFDIIDRKIIAWPDPVNEGNILLKSFTQYYEYLRELYIVGGSEMRQGKLRHTPSMLDEARRIRNGVSLTG